MRLQLIYDKVTLTFAVGEHYMRSLALRAKLLDVDAQRKYGYGVSKAYLCFLLFIFPVLLTNS